MSDTPLVTRREARQKYFEPITAAPARKVVPAPQHANKTARSRLRPDIEGLRAISILLVVLYHAGVSYLPGGYVGVDVFFVISGFLITSHLVREIATGSMSLARFYTRRALRLLPAATLVIASTLVATWYWAPVTRLKGVTFDSIAANLYVINYRLADLGTDYRTASGPPSPLQHFWSLAVEEQFYLVIPFLLIGIGLLRRHAAFVIVLALITGASLYWSVIYTESNATWAYFSTTSRAWELGAGALLAVSVIVFERLPQPLAVLLRYGGVAAIGYSAATFTDRTPFPSYWAGIPVLGAMAIIAAGQRESADPVLGNGLFTWIGARSYSWYLWHWPVLTLAPFVLGQELDLPRRLGAVALALVFAWFTYEVFEYPMRENRDLRNNPVAAFKFTGILTAAVIALAVLLPMAPPRQPLGVGTVAEVTLNGTGSAQVKALAAKIQRATEVDALPKNLKPALEDAAAAQPIVYENGCHLAFLPERTPRKCERLGSTSKKAKKTVALFGDSHAAQWFPALDVIAKERRWHLGDFTKSACSAATITMYREDLKGAYEACDTWRERALTRMIKIKPRVIVIASNYGGYANGLAGDEDAVNAAWVRAYDTTITRLQAELPKTQLVYLNDTPWPKGNAPDCLSLHPTDVQQCARSFKQATADKRRHAVLDTMDAHKVTVIDPMPWFCTLKSCPPVVGNLLVYMDQSHISPQYAELLAPLLGEQLK